MRPEVHKGEKILNRYRVVEILTSGGFALVYICWDEKLKRRVAIKSIPLTDEMGIPLGSAIDEALSEARTSGFLNHPNIVSMLDFEEDAYSAYLIMEHIEGCTLAELIEKAGIVPFDEAAHIIESIASALSYAHENGVLHLDIKPENILIDRAGTIKLTDFGMSRLASLAGWEGALGGTLGYMPPEQLQGRKPDERTDIFAFAALVYEMLSAEAPFKAESFEDSEHLILMGPRDLQEYDPELSRELELVLLEALSPMPDIRPSKIEDFCDKLLAHLGKPREGKISLVQTLAELEDDSPEPPTLPLNIEKSAELSLLDTYGNKIRNLIASAFDALLYGGISLVSLQAFSANFELSASIYFVALAICAIGFFFPHFAFALSISLFCLTCILQLTQTLSIASFLALAFFIITGLYWAKRGRHYPHELRMITLPALLGPLSLICAVPYIIAASCSVYKHKDMRPLLLFGAQQNPDKADYDPADFLIENAKPASDQVFYRHGLKSSLPLVLILAAFSFSFSLIYALFARSDSVLHFSSMLLQAAPAQNLFNGSLLFVLLFWFFSTSLLSLIWKQCWYKNLRAYSELQEQIELATKEADMSIERHYQAYENYRSCKKRNAFWLELGCIFITIVNYLLLALAESVNSAGDLLFLSPYSLLALLASVILYFCIYYAVGVDLRERLEHA